MLHFSEAIEKRFHKTLSGEEDPPQEYSYNLVISKSNLKLAFASYDKVIKVSSDFTGHGHFQ